MTGSGSRSSIGSKPKSQADTFSLATPTGLHLIQSENPSEWSKALVDYIPDWANVQPGLNSLTEALNLASDPQTDPASSRVVLFVTPVIPNLSEASLHDLTAQAQQVGAKVFVWLIAAGETSDPSKDLLQQLAVQTGGQFQMLSSAGVAPDLTPLLDPLRQVYQISYSSRI